MTSRLSTLSALAAGALLLSLTACATPADSHDYPAQVRTNFVESCLSQPGASEEMCSRCFDAVEEAYTYEEFVKLDAAINAGTATPEQTAELTEVVSTCA